MPPLLDGLPTFEASFIGTPGWSFVRDDTEGIGMREPDAISNRGIFVCDGSWRRNISLKKCLFKISSNVPHIIKNKNTKLKICLQVKINKEKINLKMYFSFVLYHLHRY